MDKEYKLRYLPIFGEDLLNSVDYINNKLKNPIAANNLLDKTEEAILSRLDSPEIFEPYHSTKNRKYPYYRIIVNNFSVFYVVIDDVMEVRRFLYNGRDIPNFL